MKKLIGATIAISLAIIALQSLIAVPSFAATQDNAGYNATVLGGQNTVVQSVSGNFGSILAGNNNTISNSIVLNNTGDWNATVDAKFVTNNGTVYGLTNLTNAIGGSNFELGKAGSLIALSNANTDNRITVAKFGVLTQLDAKLTVPTGTVAGNYSGTVLLTFGNE